jgi:hypothetical protein
MWSSQAFILSLHMLDVVGIEKLSGFFVTSSTKNFLSVGIATQKN